MSFTPEFKTVHRGRYISNSIRFPTKVEAEAYAGTMACKLTEVVDYRVVESEQPPNCTWDVARSVVAAIYKQT